MDWNDIKIFDKYLDPTSKTCISNDFYDSHTYLKVLMKTFAFLIRSVNVTECSSNLTTISDSTFDESFIVSTIKTWKSVAYCCSSSHMVAFGTTFHASNLTPVQMKSRHLLENWKEVVEVGRLNNRVFHFPTTTLQTIQIYDRGVSLRKSK